MYQPIPSEGRVIHERRVVRKKKPSMLLRVVLITFALFVVLVAAIGSGKFDTILADHHVNYAPVQYLGGESTFVKPSK